MAGRTPEAGSFELVDIAASAEVVDGRPLQSSTWSFVPPGPDSQTCAVLQRRARYEPARDESGAKLRAPIYTRTRWVLPR